MIRFSSSVVNIIFLILFFHQLCSCEDAIETTIHYLLHCLDERRTLLDNLQSIGENIHGKNDSQISGLLLFGASSNNDASNTCILNASI